MEDTRLPKLSIVSGVDKKGSALVEIFQDSIRRNGERLMNRSVESRSKRSWVKAGIVLSVCVGLALAWRWTPLSEWLTVETIIGWLFSLRGNPLGPYIVLGAYMIGSLVLFPITLLILATAYTFGPWLGFFYAMTGSLLAAVAAYGIGYLIGRDTVRGIVGGRFDSLHSKLRSHGLAAVIGTHLVPVSPFTIVNMGAGAVHVRFWDFVLGCFIGMLPGVALITFFEQQLENAFRNPGVVGIVPLCGAVGTMALAFYGGRLWFMKNLKERESGGG